MERRGEFEIEGTPEPRIEEREVRRLSRVHLVALAVVALLLVGAQVVTQVALAQLEPQPEVRTETIEQQQERFHQPVLT